MAGVLSRESILSAEDLVTEEVEVPEWGGTVLVRTLTAKERDAFEESMVETRGKGRNKTRELRINNVRAALVVRVIVDAQGQRLFRDTDAELLGNKSGKALDRVWDVASRLAGMTDDDVEELLGNSESDPTEPSASS